ncbi:MAG TPA: SMI1/KNR4 family protein [Tepidisphaeraceae bacterium]|nr:SMI1/KNR4 family protein [Tepidisphaeraceae bacterium]
MIENTTFFQSLRDAGAPLQEADVAAFERELGVPLPADYRAFLLLRNGGRFNPHVEYPLPTEEYSDHMGLFHVYGLLRPPGANTDLRHQLEVHDGRIPRGTLPIGDDGDNLLLIGLEGERRGKLYLWVRDDEMFKDAEDNRIPVADSFAEMAASARPYEAT